MLRLLPFLCLLLFTVGACAPDDADQPPAADAASADTSGFVPLFNGEDLSGWYAMGGDIDSWAYDGETLSTVAEDGGWLTTEQTYDDFVLRLDWRIPEEGNSGVGLRYPDGSHVAHDGMEIQILDDDAEIHEDIEPAQHTGSIYYQVAAEQGAANPVGEWNTYEITAEGPHIVIRLNGTVIVDANMDEETVGHGDYTPLSERPRSGHIGLQSHDTPVDFRNVEIREL